jgi:hypothetical protein
MKSKELWCDACLATMVVTGIDRLCAGAIVECEWCYEPHVITQSDIETAIEVPDSSGTIAVPVPNHS